MTLTDILYFASVALAVASRISRIRERRRINQAESGIWKDAVKDDDGSSS